MDLYVPSFWPCGPSFPCLLAFSAFISLQFSFLGLHFLAFWHFGPSFPCTLAFWALIALHFGILGLDFLTFWPQMGRFPNFQYKEFNSARPGSSLQFLAFWAFISLHFGLSGLPFLAIWPFGPSFPCILAFWWPSFPCISLLGLHFLAFWPCGLSFPCILASWAFISLHFCLFGVSFWDPSSPQVAKNGLFAERPYNGFISAVTGTILQFFSLLGLYFLAFWPCRLSFPCILASWAFISLHFCLFGVSFWGPPHKLPKMARLPNVLTMDLSAP